MGKKPNEYKRIHKASIVNHTDLSIDFLRMLVDRAKKSACYKGPCVIEFYHQLLLGVGVPFHYGIAFPGKKQIRVNYPSNMQFPFKWGLLERSFENLEELLYFVLLHEFIHFTSGHPINFIIDCRGLVETIDMVACENHVNQKCRRLIALDKIDEVLRRVA